MRALDMHTTVMDIMVNVLGGSTEAGKQISTSQVSIILIWDWGNGWRVNIGKLVETQGLDTSKTWCILHDDEKSISVHIYSDTIRILT